MSAHIYSAENVRKALYTIFLSGTHIPHLDEARYRRREEGWRCLRSRCLLYRRRRQPKEDEVHLAVLPRLRRPACARGHPRTRYQGHGGVTEASRGYFVCFPLVVQLSEIDLLALPG